MFPFLLKPTLSLFFCFFCSIRSTSFSLFLKSASTLVFCVIRCFLFRSRNNRLNDVIINGVFSSETSTRRSLKFGNSYFSSGIIFKRSLFRSLKDNSHIIDSHYQSITHHSRWPCLIGVMKFIMNRWRQKWNKMIWTPRAIVIHSINLFICTT